MFGLNNGSGDSVGAPSVAAYGSGPMSGRPAAPEPPAEQPGVPPMPSMPAGPSATEPSAPTVPIPPPKSQPDDDLVQIKQEALQSLTPLVGHLDQTPEEKFKTIMMMLQASDNQVLVQQAYAAANEISDQKTRAQALLDVINEINYFTQHQENNAQ